MVHHQAKLASKAKLDAIVCSPQEIEIVKKFLKRNNYSGIRLSGDSKGDQRVMTPKEAFQRCNSASYG